MFLGRVLVPVSAANFSSSLSNSMGKKKKRGGKPAGSTGHSAKPGNQAGKQANTPAADSELTTSPGASSDAAVRPGSQPAAETTGSTTTTTSATANGSGVRQPVRGWKRFVFPVVAITLGLSPFVLLEIGLTIADLGNPSRIDDPMVGFSNLQPLFTKNKQDEYETAHSKRLFFGNQTFPVEKPRSGFRVFCLGGSTVRGRPYETPTSFCRWLGLELAHAMPDKSVESINCGGLSYASYRLSRILQEVGGYQPDLIVIATGHNEFLEDRTYQPIKQRSQLVAWFSDRMLSLRSVNYFRDLMGRTGPPTTLSEQVEAKLDKTSGYGSYHRDQEWYQQVAEHYEQSLRRMIQYCRQLEIPVVLVRLGCNLRDTPPFKSENADDLSTKKRNQWQSLFERAAEVEETGDFAGALEILKQAEAIDDQHALLNFRIARCLDATKDFAAANKYYTLARDLDICPLRMTTALYERFDRVVADTRVPTTDARTMLEGYAANGIPGNGRYVDHVHPSMRAHQLIAEAITLTLRKANIISDKHQWTPAERRQAYRKHFDSLQRNFVSNGKIRIKWLEDWAQRHRLLNDTYPIDHRGLLHLAQKRIGFEQYKAAWQIYDEVLKRDIPAVPKLMLGFAYELLLEGRPVAAQEILDRYAEHPAFRELQPEVEAAAYVLALNLEQGSQAWKIRKRSATKLAQQLKQKNPWLATLTAKQITELSATTEAPAP